MESYYFITSGFKSELQNNVINESFKSLNTDHKSILLDYLSDIIDVIAIKFNFRISQRDIYEQQFRQNNYKDAIGLLYLLLPFINENINKGEIQSLNELYIKKMDDNVNINEVSPKYKYTNLEYGRCNRDNGIATEIQFSKEHIEHNYILLLETIKTVANKLYVNWINIRPTSSKDFSPMKETFNTIISHSVGEWDPTDKKSKYRLNRGMDISEIYNITSNYLFHEIFKIKWILYEIFPNEKSFTSPLRFLDALSLLVDISPAVKNIPWESLDKDIQDHLTFQWNRFIDLFNKGGSYDILKNDHIIYLMKTLIIFFDRRFGHKLEKSGYIKLVLDGDKKDEEDNDEDDIIERMEQLDNLRKTVMSLENKMEYIYEYIRECLLTLRSTWYSQFYLKYNGDGNEYEYETDKSKMFVNLNYYVTPKNVYNYAKSLISYSDPITKKYIQYPKYWKSLNDDDKKVIISRINHNNDNTITDWFNINRYLTGTVKLSSDNAKRRNIEIHNLIQTAFGPIMYDVLERMGLLSEFIPDPKLSNYKFLPENVPDRNKEIISRLGKYVINNSEDRPIWENSFYYLNGLEYKYLYNTFKHKKMKYIDALTDSEANIAGWITTYAMDWISQIGFFHHYLNNRIIYVTGSTGVGKSTQAPKLFLYALKMLDYKNNGNIICTQPRIAPTRKNAKMIAAELGVPIEYDTETETEIETDNYYVQYKYKEKNHENKIHQGLSLKIVTDAILEQQLRNPVLKRMYGDTEKNFTPENIYDIVMVDEAHEHNINMDLILTKMKYVTYYNNDIKLVIISATMNDDEPVYRRYYRDINDNRMFPLNLWIQKHNLDRINIDRRIHISPPGETTQYKIIEYDRPEINSDDLVIDIANTTSSGEILLFKSGEADIKKARDYINSKTDSSIIALPFFSKMSNEKREFVEGISKNKNKLDIPKTVNFEDDYEKDSTIKKVPKGTYTRVIVIATNIAEASITIPTLKYVVDTGTEKVNMFNYKIRSANLSEMPISDSSRLQRRGRVGRTGPGTVYYTYKSENTKNNKIKFKISIDNISEKLFDMLKSGDDNIQYFTANNDPNTISTLNFSNLTNLYGYDLGKMIRNQYFTKSTFYNYQGNVNHYDYQNRKRPYDYYVTGFDKRTLDDMDGSFYIVHPDELCFERNILGIIVSLTENKECNVKLKNNEIQSTKMKTFWEILSEYLLVVRENDDLYKTQFGENIMALKAQFESSITIQQLLSYIYSRIYNCEKDMIKLIAMYMTINSPKDIVLTKQIDGKYRSMMENSLSLYGNSYGDSFALITIANNIISNPVLRMNEYNNEENEDDMNKETKKNNFKIWCESQYLNSDMVLSFIKNYNSLLRDIQKYKDNISNLDPEITNVQIKDLEWFDTHTPKLLDLSQIQQEDKIKIALLQGYSYNVAKNIAIIKDNYYYINIFRPSIKNVYNIPKLFKVGYETKKKIINNSFLKDTSMYSTLLYINQDEDNDSGDIEITFIENIPPNIISQVIPQILDTSDKYDTYLQEQEIKLYLNTLGVNQKPLLLQKIIKNYIEILTDVKTDLYNNYDKNIFEKLKVVDDRPKIRELITDMFRDKISELFQMGGGYKDSSYVRDIIALVFEKLIK